MLVDRGHRELPIQADFVGKNLPTSRRRACRCASTGRCDGRDEVEIQDAMKKDLLGIEDLTADEIYLILDTAEAMREIGQRADQEGADAARQDRREPVLRAEHAHPHLVRDRREAPERRHAEHRASRPRASLKGETLLDTALNIEAMAPDMIVMRHAASGAATCWRGVCKSRIINAGDGMHEHPTQALLDAFTIREHKERIEGLKVAIVGDMLHSRVLRSNVLLLTKLGADVWLCGPPTLMPRASSGSACASRPSVDEAVDDADVVMMLRIQQERMQGAFFPSLREYFDVFGMTAARVARAKPDVDHHAPRADEPRRRDRLGRRRRSVFGHPRTGRQRRRRADGGAVPAGRRPDGD